MPVGFSKFSPVGRQVFENQLEKVRDSQPSAKFTLLKLRPKLRSLLLTIASGEAIHPELFECSWVSLSNRQLWEQKFLPFQRRNMGCECNLLKFILDLQVAESVLVVPRQTECCFPAKKSPRVHGTTVWFYSPENSTGKQLSGPHVYQGFPPSPSTQITSV